jgi:hypothetical protein
MKILVATLGAAVLGLGLTSTAVAQPAPPPPQVQIRPHEEAPNPDTRWVHTYPTGQWVYTTDYSWVWVPEASSTTVVEGVPYVHLYTRAHGWNWYVSPWGVGAYHYGQWVTHPWRPSGWQGGDWVAQPQVVTRIHSMHRR